MLTCKAWLARLVIHCRGLTRTCCQRSRTFTSWLRYNDIVQNTDTYGDTNGKKAKSSLAAAQPTRNNTAACMPLPTLWMRRRLYQRCG